MPRDGSGCAVGAKPSSASYRARYLSITEPEAVRLTDRVEVMAIVSGTGCRETMSASGEHRGEMLGEGQVVVLRPNDRATLSSPGGAEMRALSVGIPFADWLDFVTLAGIEQALLAGDSVPAVAVRAESGLRPFLEAHRLSGGSPTRRDLVRFLADAMEILPAGPGDGAPVPTWLTSALREMCRESNLRAGLPRFVELARVTSAHLSATTGRFLGMTPTALIRELRLSHAARLLATTRDGIGVVAGRCGFPSVAYFSTSFRARYGVAPSRYRLQRAAPPR